jgi:uncharacterized pyridoxamine 5'-phosphate oxidase family protein
MLTGDFDMSEIIQFLLDSKVFYLATQDGDQPRVRPMGFAMDFEGKLCFCTNNKKDMFKQMEANPKVEISAFGGDGQTLRITGKVGFTGSRAAKEKALEIMPDLKYMYSADDGIFEIFFIDTGTAILSGMKGEKRELSF